ncbi:MAG TPA: hypothetical protein VFR31_14960 [Thermoanaerobaculia bacterium]|nr:hypothetical protein [Thermoanaerobaculia bacterium]
MRASLAWRRRIALGAVLFGCIWLAVPVDGGEDRSPIRLIERYLIAGEGTGFTDVRWASDNSVFLSRALHGVVEIELSEALAKRSQPIPDARVLRPSLKQVPKFEQLAVSTRYLATASKSYNLTWRSLQRPANGAVRFEHAVVGNIDDIDLLDDRVLFLGTPMLRTFDPKSRYENKGGIAWLGVLSPGLKDLKPVLFDLSGPALEHHWACSTIGLGAVRFFRDGSFVVVPGYQPGAHLFDPTGKLVRSWTGNETGLTTGCSGMGMDDGIQLRSTLEGILSWLNERRVLDDVIPLPEGPGLLVRYLGKDGKLHWELRVLHEPGGVEIYALPLESRTLSTRLHADVRGRRVVFLLASERYLDKNSSALGGELVIAEVRQLRKETS